MALNHPLFYGWHKVIDMHQITSWARKEIDFAEKKASKSGLWKTESLIFGFI